MGNIVKLSRRSRVSQEQAELLRRYALDLELSPEARAELDNALYRVTETPGRRWVFVMISPEQFRFVMQATKGTRQPDLNWRVFSAAITYLRMDSGEIVATRKQLARDAGTNPDEVSRAMGELSKIGAIIRQRHGRRIVYFVNPTVGWNGGEGARQEAAKSAPQLRLVETPGE